MLIQLYNYYICNYNYLQIKYLNIRKIILHFEKTIEFHICFEIVISDDI